MSRRWRDGDRDWSLAVLLLLAGVAGHLSWALTEAIHVDLYPLPWIVAVWAGYKMGRWGGLLTGALSVLPWTLEAALQDNQLSWRELLLGGGWLEPFAEARSIAVRGFSLQDAVIAGLLGYAAGWIFDRLERRLGSRLEELVPVAPRRGPLPALLSWAERRLTGEPPGPPPSWRAALRRIGGLGLPLLLVLLNLALVIRAGPVLGGAPPRLLAAAAILLVAFHLGSAAGIGLALFTWLGSWAAWFAFAGELAGEGLPGGGAIELGLRDVPQVVGLCVLVWWAARLGEIQRDPQRRGALAALWTPALRSAPARAAPPVALVAVLALLAAGFEAELGPLRIAYGPHYLWFLVLALWAARRDPARVASRAFWVLLPLSLVAFDMRLLPALERPRLEPFTLSPDALQAALLAAVPLVAGRLDLGRLETCRALAYGFLSAWTLAAVFLAGGLFADDHALHLLHWVTIASEFGVPRLAEHPLPVVSWTLQLLLFELAARCLHRFAGADTPRAENRRSAGAPE
jgi:hypothetical protein